MLKKARDRQDLVGRENCKGLFNRLNPIWALNIKFKLYNHLRWEC